MLQTRWPKVVELGYESSGPGSNTGWGHGAMFLGKTLKTHSASI